MVLFPMSFREIDEARKSGQSLGPSAARRGRKRKSSEGDAGSDIYVSERRTGRWTPEETAYCDKLIECFGTGKLPLPDGVKLNEFLGNMLKSKQSRLTKKMKNAKLSTKTYKASTGHLNDPTEARDFAEAEDAFFRSVQDHQERAEIKFHMQKEWREHMSSFCLQTGQPLDGDSWLSSVEEMDRRATRAKDAARMARRKLMMGYALKADTAHQEQGVFIEKSSSEVELATADLLEGHGDSCDTDELLALFADNPSEVSAPPVDDGTNGKSRLLHAAPFLDKTIAYLQRHHVPFEHVDVWVPSFVPGEGGPGGQGESSTCRLCFAGCATVEEKVDPDTKTTVPMSGEEQFNLLAFGDYSQKFSFDINCGLPGRVYQSGLPTWEQSVHNAPHQHFERCGGALQWGIKTVVGIPIASPNVGRIVVTLYSRYDRPKDQELVGRLSEEFTRLLPSPKWKLVVDVGEPETQTPAAVVETTIQPTEVSTAPTSASDGSGLVEEIVSLLGQYMPSDPSSPVASYLPGFMALRLMLLRPSKTPEDEELMGTVLSSFTSYSESGRTKKDIAIMLARDYMFLTQDQPNASNPPLFLGLGQSMMSSAPTPSLGLSVFGSHLDPVSSPNSSYANSPALAPIVSSGSGPDSISIVSN